MAPPVFDVLGMFPVFELPVFEMLGMIAGVDIDRCDISEYPADCYKLNHQLAMNHSLFFYTKYNNELSPIAKMVFSESYDGYQKSVQKLYDIAHSKTPENLCEFFQTPPEELSACVSDINSFKQRVLNSKIQ